MPISGQEAFMVLRGLRDNQTPLVIFRMSKSEGMGTIRGIILEVDESSEQIIVRPEGSRESAFVELSGATFEFGSNAADTERNATFLQVHFGPGGTLIFLEAFK